MPAIRNASGQFVKGVSGNPTGRLKVLDGFREAMRGNSQEAVALVVAALASENLEHQRWAVNLILAYAWGKPPRYMDEGAAGVSVNINAADDAPPVDIVDLAKKVAWLLSQGAAEAARRGGNVRIIPIPIDQDACAQSRRPMEMIFQG